MSTISNEENISTQVDLKPIETKFENGDSKTLKPGEARIKPEYLIKDVKREINLSFISDEDKLKIEQQQATNISDTKRSLDENNADGDVKSKKVRLQGQNKHRRNEMFRKSKNKQTVKYCYRYASNLGNNLSINPCHANEKCRYSHNLNEFITNKRNNNNNNDDDDVITSTNSNIDNSENDLEQACHMFDVQGFCPYGVLCKFSKSHIKNEIENIVDEEKWKAKTTVNELNQLTGETKINLQRKRYNFTSSEKIIEKIKINHDSEKFSIVDSKLDNEFVRTWKKIDFNGKLYLAPLTTVGNLPFRRIGKHYGADITCSEMAMAYPLLDARMSEWALLKRHPCEDVFGVQLCGCYPDVLTKVSQLINENCQVDFIDLNMGCPIDIVFRKGAGAGLMDRRKKLNEIIYGVTSLSDVPLTLKMRTGIYEKKNIANKVIEAVKEQWTDDRVALFTLHGRSREQRYTKSADWSYIDECSKLASPIPLFGSGDVFSYEDYYKRLEETNVSGIMIGRAALIKPWIFTEIKEKRHWDISSSERFDMLKKYVNYGLEHWGSDSEGVETTRRFLLEWLSFLYRYIPVGLLEHLPQKINDRPPLYKGRDELETLMASPACSDWIKISEMLLGPVHDSFHFLPKHKANAYN